MESPYINTDGTNVLYEYVATGLDHLQLYLPITQQTSPIVFAITGTDTIFDAIKPLGFLLDYVGLPSFGGFSIYEAEYQEIKTKVLQLLGGLIANDVGQNTREIIFTSHSMGCYTSFRLYSEMVVQHTYTARLKGVKAFCPFIWNDDICVDMRSLCAVAQIQSEIEIFAIKDDYSSALFKTPEHVFGTIKWYDGDGSLDYADVNVFSQITMAAYATNANHTIDNFSPTDPVNVQSSLPKADYGASKSINTKKEALLTEAGFGQTNLALLLYSDDVDTAGIKFDIPNVATTDDQFGFSVNYDTTYHNKYFYYNYSGNRYVSLLTELQAHNPLNAQGQPIYKPAVYFQKYTETLGGTQNYLMYDYDGTNKQFIKLKQGLFADLLLPSNRVGGQTYNFQYTERQTNLISYEDVFGTTGIAQGAAGYKAAATGDSLERFLFHIVPAIDNTHSQRRTITNYTEPYDLYDILPNDGTTTQNYKISFVNPDNTYGSAGQTFYITQTYTAQTRGVNFSPSFVQSAWTGWQVDPDFNPPDESVFTVQALSYNNNIVSIVSTLPSASLGVFGQALDTNNPLDTNVLTFPAHSFAWFQITDFTYVSATRFTCKLKHANKATDPYHKFYEPSSSANDGTTGWYGEMRWSNQTDALTYTFDKL